MDIIDIDTQGDFVVEVIENSGSAPTNHWKEASQSVVSLGEGHPIVTEVWLRVVHHAKLIYNLLLPEIWLLVQAIDYYALDITAFNEWFATWYQRLNFGSFIAAKLLFPTWRFNYARGFARWTHHLAYEDTGHITERNPTKLYQYYLPPRLIRKSSLVNPNRYMLTTSQSN